jgi:hypothetical protein
MEATLSMVECYLILNLFAKNGKLKKIGFSTVWAAQESTRCELFGRCPVLCAASSLLLALFPDVFPASYLTSSLPAAPYSEPRRSTAGFDGSIRAARDPAFASPDGQLSRERRRPRKDNIKQHQMREHV